MWSCERSRRGASRAVAGLSARAKPRLTGRTLRAGLGLALMLGLAGCIHPLYGQNGVSAQLAEIQVAPIPDRVGHYLAEELKFQTDGSGMPPDPRYRLEVKVTENVGGLIVNLRTLSSDAAAVNLSASYTLTEIATGKVIYSGGASANASYDRSEQRYANVRAARDAEIRAANVLADQIRTRLGIVLLSQK